MMQLNIKVAINYKIAAVSIFSVFVGHSFKHLIVQKKKFQTSQPFYMGHLTHFPSPIEKKKTKKLA